ncbi:putative bifunctional diguanylate cyclase/phosphodiesterase [Granulosicoccus sp. 3-233]|uniref:putative bifunctional diguanylate cyclase/phosphodiesterase n=1 Tax=Granulosicoccus sp. 3-233 TaxID=3417969 RepID=UPI003D3293FE
MHTSELGHIHERPTLAEALDGLARHASGRDVSLERQQFEALLQYALDVSGGDYGFVLSPAGAGAYAEQFVKLGAAVERDKSGRLLACHDTLTDRRPDPMILSVMRLNRGVQGKPIDIGLPQCLPGSHPPIRYFLMVPMQTGVSLTSVLFVANPAVEQLEHGGGETTMKRLQDMCAVLSARLHSDLALTDNQLQSPGIDDGARHYVQLMNASLNAVVIVDSTGKITAFNPSAETLFGRDSVHAIGTSLDRYLPTEFLMPILKRAASMDVDSAPQTTVPIEQRSVTATAESGCSVHLKTSAYFTQLESMVYTTFVFEHESSTTGVPDTSTGHQHFKALTNVAPVGIIQLAADWTCDYANDMWCQLSGLSMDESIGEGWVDSLHAEDVVDALVELREALSESRIFSKNIRLQRPTGSISWVSLSATATINDLGQFTGCLLVLLDITETYKASERMRYAATHDVLTGLANRTSFLDKLQSRLDSSRQRVRTALLYLDLDGFKTVNDTLGHDCGDELLRQVAYRLRTVIRGEDICARLGGDEFTIILTSACSMEEVCAIAETIVRGFNQPFEVFDNDLNLSVSIGIALANEQSSSSDAFIKQADTALYKAKASGRSRWIVYTREFQHEDKQRSALGSRIRRATERHEFTLVYQPQFRIEDRSIVSFEALLRWSPNDMPSPDTQLLVSVLEESGLINDVGQWVLETACQQHRQWLDDGLVDESCTISVNVSVAQLSLANFTSRLQRILERSNLPAHCLNIEITESALIEKNSSCIRVMNEVKDMGVKLSLDDFGTGYASLAYLTRLPIDFLKIDKSFVMAMNSDETSRTIVMSVLALAGTLNIDVVAEGIENEGTLVQLREASCQYGQGFLVARPMMVDEVEALMRVEDCQEAGIVELS